MLLTLALAGNVTAQEDEPDRLMTERAGPPRLLETEAPQREPRTLEHTVTPEGLVNSVIEMPAESDAYIASEWPNQNFGVGALYLGYHLPGEHNFGAERVLLRFDVTGNIPQGAVVNDARLRLYLSFSSPSDDAPMGTILRRLGSTWSESGEVGVTWNSEPTWGEIRAEAEVGSAITWYEWDVTDLVGDWVARTHPNHGMEIMGDERVQQRERAFYSRESTDQFYPRLVVDYMDFNDTEAPIVTVDALPEYVGRDFTISWSGTDTGGSGIASYDVQYRVDGGDWANWIVDATFSSAVFAAGQDGKFYEFRARGEDRAGNVEIFAVPEASTTVDAEPPTTSVNPLPAITRVTSFPVTWTGQDDGSGIWYYDVRYRFNEGSWFLWQHQTLAVSIMFTAMNDGLYDFEARAVDKLGTKEDFTGQPEASIIVDAEQPFVEPRAWLPLIFDNS
jgi:hypothetical protein